MLSDWLSDGKLRIDCQKGSASGWLPDGIWGETSGSQFGEPVSGNQSGALPSERLTIGHPIWNSPDLGENLEDPI